MANEVQRICNVCQNSYKYCRNCDRKLPTWYSMFDSENCKKIFDILTEYNFGKVSKSEANEILMECDLSQKENFRQKLQDEINAIMEKPKPKRGMRAKAQIFDDVAAPVLEEIKNEAPVPSEE